MILADWLAEAPFGLAMSSGFFSFFAHTGMLDALTARGFAPSHVAGSSAGALVAGAWAAGLEAPELASVLDQLRREDFWDPAPGAGLLAGRAFDAMLRRMLPVHALRDCRVPARISVFDIVGRRTRIIADGDLARAIRASCAVPGLFHPVWIESSGFAGARSNAERGAWIARRPCWDGGIFDRAGIAGVLGGRLLFHHISSRSPWRTRLVLPRRAQMVTLVIDDLPRSGPFRLDAGRRALAHARDATARALALPIDADGVVRVSAAA
jgi:NTE family protein